MTRPNLKAIVISLIIPATAALALAGCRDRAEYEPPGYAPPPPPPPAAAPTAAAAPEPMSKVDPLTLTPRLTDPEDAQGKVADLKSAIAGVWEDQMVIKFELYGPPPEGNDVWFLAWLACDPDPELLMLQVSLSERNVTGGVYIDDSRPMKAVRYSEDVKIDGNSVIVRFPWSRMPEKYQVRDLKLQSPTVIKAKAEGEGEGTEVVDEISGFDRVRT